MFTDRQIKQDLCSKTAVLSQMNCVLLLMAVFPNALEVRRIPTYKLCGPYYSVIQNINYLTKELELNMTKARGSSPNEINKV